MAVEPTNENKDAAEPQNPAPGPMLTDEDLESPSKKRKVPVRRSGERVAPVSPSRAGVPIGASPPPALCRPSVLLL